MHLSFQVLMENGKTLIGLAWGKQHVSTMELSVLFLIFFKVGRERLFSVLSTRL